MKERPILFQGDMVRAILEDRKTQTRRVMKPQPFRTTTYAPGFGQRWVYKERISEDYLSVPKMFNPWLDICPYGQPGDQFWVRETWALRYRIQGQYYGHIESVDDVVFKTEFNDSLAKDIKWKPSIFMPRAASRIQLLIKDIRVERLQDISIADALAEGIKRHPFTAVTEFEKLWNKINGKKSPWEKNWWLWVIEFERITP